jgi:hypothetical protein
MVERTDATSAYSTGNWLKIVDYILRECRAEPGTLAEKLQVN